MNVVQLLVSSHAHNLRLCVNWRADRAVSPPVQYERRSTWAAAWTCSAEAVSLVVLAGSPLLRVGVYVCHTRPRLEQEISGNCQQGDAC